LSVTSEPFDSHDARRLVAALDAALTELYPPDQRFGPNLKADVGFTQIDCWGEYSSSPTSICFKKNL
jgi:hypothetical protein